MEKEKIKWSEKWTVLCVGVFLVLAIAAVFLFVKRAEVVGSITGERYSSGEITDTVAAEGTFVPSSNFLQSIGFMIRLINVGGAGEVILEVYDEFGEVLCASQLEIGKINGGYMNDFPLNIEVEQGGVYTYKIYTSESCQTPITIELGTTSTSPVETQNYIYNGEELANTLPMMQYTYLYPMNFESSRVYIVCIFVAAILALLFVRGEHR